MNAVTNSRVLLSALFTVALAAAPAFSQSKVERADALLIQAIAAEELASQSESADARADAARLHLESARLRPATDLQGLASMRTAALYYSYNQPAEGARLMSIVAERALEAGDVLTAANAYLDAAATLMQRPGNRMTPSDFAKVQIWIGQASTLADSPQIPAVVAETIKRRVGPDQGNFAG